MAMSLEQREAARQRMKDFHARRKLNPPPANGHTSTTSTSATPVVLIDQPSIEVNVDWNTVEIQVGQHFYAQLKREFEKAGSTLNARLMKRLEPGFDCFICKKHFECEPKGRDDSYFDQETGLIKPVRVCGEICWAKYQQKVIDERRERNIAAKQAADAAIR